MKGENAAKQWTSETETAMAGRPEINLGRDELNLAEFPLAALSRWVPEGQKTLVFEDTIWDKGHRRPVTRRLTVAASDKYGLPAALDDEVIFGLVQLTKGTEFASRTVQFTRYQLAQVLGWQDGGKSYRRLEESLKRWLGVTLYYENAWWDKRSQRWADAHFHLLDNVVLYHRRPGNIRKERESPEASRSSFTWNEVVFRSFQAGYLKQIDVELYRNLALATAKRMYRYLDKRFHFSCWLQFDLSRFAHEHIGLSRGYDVAQLKRRLEPAIQELERAGFLEPMEVADRYHRLHRGAWRVVFLKKVTAKRQKAARADAGLTERLMQRGVTPSAARGLVREFPEGMIQEKIHVFDELIGRQDNRVSRNPAGYLVQSIREDYRCPDGRRHVAQRPPATAAGATQRQTRLAAHQEGSRRRTVDQHRRNQVQEYLRRLSPSELAQLEQLAIASAPRVTADGYDRAKAAGNSRRFEQYRQLALQYHVERLLTEAASHS